MKKNYSDDDIIKILGMASIRNVVIDTRIAETIESIRQEKEADKRRKASAWKELPHRGTHTIWKKAAYGLGTVAAVLFVLLGICVANPSLAANIPILGNIFAKVQEVFPFGRIPEDETMKLYNEEIKANHDVKRNDADPNHNITQPGKSGKDILGKDTSEVSAIDGSKENTDFIYRDQDSKITVTFTEYYASNQAIFFGVCIESEEAFPSFAVMGDTGYQLIQANTEEQYSFRDTVVGGFRNIEGRMEDAHTFAGIMRVDYDSINVDDSKYESEYWEAEEKGKELPMVTAETWEMYMEIYEIPKEFEMRMKIKSLQGYCREEIDVESGNRYKVHGNWEFPPLTIEKSDKDVQTIQIGEVNQQGIGLDMIEISPVELTLHTVEPIDRLTFAVALDKNGKKLASGSSNAYELAIAGHDISTVTVYICDYDEYMDEIKAYVLEDDEKFKNMLEEKALFKREVDTQRD